MDLKKHLQDAAAVAADAVSQYDVDVAAAKAEGIEEGRGQIQLPEPTNPDAQYTQAQMNEAVSTAVENERNASAASIAAAQQATNEARAALESKDSEHKAAVSSLKKDIAGKIRNAKIDDEAIAAELEKEEG